MTARPGLALALAVGVSCGGTQSAPLGPAGSPRDDGTGQLAAQSVRLDVGEEDPGQDPRRPRRYIGDESADYDPFGYGGYGYGGCMYGGCGYGNFGIGYSGAPPPAPPYAGAPVYDGSTITGTVRWRGDGGVAWPPGCDAGRVAHAGTVVGDAVVYLDGLTAGRALPYGMTYAHTGGVLVVDECALRPVVQTVSPLPSPVVVENGDRRAVKLVSEHAGMTTPLELEPGGRLDLSVERVGDLRVSDGVRAPAWVIGQAHPYYVITDADGRFTLDEVPTGTYELVVWYPPLVSQVTASGPLWTAASVERRRITVPRRGVVKADMLLSPAR